MAPIPYTTTVPIISAESCGEESISRTYQYRKVMKPMLERKRRARINRCLDELKELMVIALQSEGENVSKLEKADILELTVRHLHNLKRQHQLTLPPQEQLTYADRFRAGFNQCAQEVTHFISKPTPEIVDPAAGRKLLQHLSACVHQLDNVAQNVQIPSSQQDHHHHHHQQQGIQQNHLKRGLTPPISPGHEFLIKNNKENNSPASMWRPW